MKANNNSFRTLWFFYTAIETRKLNMAISSKNMIPKLINLGFHSFFKGVQLRKKMGVSYRFLEIFHQRFRAAPDLLTMSDAFGNRTCQLNKPIKK
jgi:hypothetical protein